MVATVFAKAKKCLEVFCAVQAIHHQLVFVGEHLVHAAFVFTGVFFFPVDGIRKILVIG